MSEEKKQPGPKESLESEAKEKKELDLKGNFEKGAKEKNSSNLKFSIRFFVLAGVIIYASIVFGSQQSQLQEQLLNMQQLQQTQKDLESEIAFLENELEFIDTTEYVEQAARERLGWIKPNEIVFRKAKDGDAEALNSQAINSQNSADNEKNNTEDEGEGNND